MYRPQSGGACSLQFLGAPVSLRLSNGELVGGEVFCCDVNNSNTVVLREQKPEGRATLRLVPSQHVRSIFAHGPAPQSMDMSLPACDIRVLQERERSAIAAFKAMQHTIGVGVTQSAQDLFDFIHKTHPDCCWAADGCISVMGVTVKPPYTSETCQGQAKGLERIRQVVERFHQRRGLGHNGSSSPNIAPTDRSYVPVEVRGPTDPPAPQPQQASYTDEAGNLYLASPQGGPSLMPFNPANPNVPHDPNRVMVFQPAAGGHGMFMMLLPTTEGSRSGPQVVATTGATVTNGPPSYYAPLLLAGPNGSAMTAMSAPPPNHPNQSPGQEPMIVIDPHMSGHHLYTDINGRPMFTQTAIDPSHAVYHMQMPMTSGHIPPHHTEVMQPQIQHQMQAQIAPQMQQMQQQGQAVTQTSDQSVHPPPPQPQQQQPQQQQRQQQVQPQRIESSGRQTAPHQSGEPYQQERQGAAAPMKPSPADGQLLPQLRQNSHSPTRQGSAGNVTQNQTPNHLGKTRSPPQSMSVKKVDPGLGNTWSSVTTTEEEKQGDFHAAGIAPMPDMAPAWHQRGGKNIRNQRRPRRREL